MAQRYAEIRAHSLVLTEGLTAEYQCIQSMPDAIPLKWHLAHTSWFFETLVLSPHDNAYQPFDHRFAYLFNSYYEAMGPRHPRPQRGLLSRPCLADIQHCRIQCGRCGAGSAAPASELMLTDLLHLLSCNPLLQARQAAGSNALPVAASTADLQ